MPLPAVLHLASLAPWLLDAVALWIVVGLLGSLLSRRRGEHARARRGLLTIVIVTGLYLTALLALSLTQPATILAPGQPRCFDDVCFTILAAQELPGFQARDQTRDRLVRIAIELRNTNHDRAAREPDLRPILVDDRGRRWPFVPGLAGVSLSTRLQPGGTAISDPIFRVAPDSNGLYLELRHTGWYAGRLTLGDPESLLHRPTRMALPTPKSALPTTNSPR